MLSMTACLVATHKSTTISLRQLLYHGQYKVLDAPVEALGIGGGLPKLGQDVVGIARNNEGLTIQDVTFFAHPDFNFLHPVEAAEQAFYLTAA
jgi:hypothetical protein